MATGGTMIEKACWRWARARRSRPTCGARRIASTIRISVVSLPSRPIACGVVSGLRGSTKPCTTSVEPEFSDESTLDMIVAISPARTSPVTPTGSTVVTSAGNTMSASGQVRHHDDRHRAGQHHGEERKDFEEATELRVADVLRAQHAPDDILILSAKSGGD